MKLEIVSTENAKSGEIELPEQFREEVNADLIARAVFALQSRKRHRYGSAPQAGKRQSAKLSRRRRDYRGSYGFGISRVPRKIMSGKGSRLNWEGAFAPGTVGGRKAHPPKPKVWEKKMNKKERRKAICSALAATMSKDIVSKNHKVPEAYPFAIADEIEKLVRTKEVVVVLKKLGMEKELERTSKRVRRAGRGKLRGRKRRTKSGLLIVVAKSCGLIKAARNLAGVEIMEVDRLNAEALAPGAVPGRAALFTGAAIERIRKEKLFSR
jgi:large subunit ribosomal protein L4e